MQNKPKLETDYRESETSVSRSTIKKYNRLNFKIHNYFLAKSLDLVRPGRRIPAFVTSRYTFDSQNTDVRSYLAERADLSGHGAVRLPRMHFVPMLGTDVVSDIIFLQKRDTPALDIPAWVQTDENADGFLVNRYFLLKHPEMVLGKQSSRSTQYGKPEYTVLPLLDADSGEQLREAVSHIHGKYQAAVHEDEESKSETDVIPADPMVKNYSYTIVKGRCVLQRKLRHETDESKYNNQIPCCWHD